MKIPLKIAFRDIPPSEAIARQIHERAEKLELFSGQITSCRVTVGKAHRKHHKGNLYYVRIDLTVPGEEIVAGSAHDVNGAHEDVYVALRDSFAVVQRKLQNYIRRRRVRLHPKEQAAAPHGRITRLAWDGSQGYGFITTMDGRELYFHGNSVLNATFDRLAVGTEIRFSEEAGENGPQASSVELVHPRLRRPDHAA